MNIKIIITFFILILCIKTQGQNKNFEKAKIAYQNNKAKAANKYIDKCLQDDNLKDMPNVLLLKSKIMYSIYQDKSLNEKFPNAFKESVKFLEKSLSKIESNTAKQSFYLQNITYIQNLIKLNNKEGVDAYNSGKYAKALPIFKRSLSFGSDTQSLVYIGNCYWEMGQRYESVEYYKQASQMIYAYVSDSSAKVLNYYREPFRKLGKYFIDKKQYDTAYIHVRNGKEVIPNDPKLMEYTYHLMRYAMEKIPPSEDYLIAVDRGLTEFPLDSFLNHKENAIFIFLLNGLANNNDQKGFDELMSKFAEKKKNKEKIKDKILKYDVFAGMGKQDFFNQLYQYLGDIGLRKACFAAFNTLNNQFPIANNLHKQRHIIIDRSVKPVYAEILFKEYLTIESKNLNHINGRKEYTSEINKTSIPYLQKLSMIWLNDDCAKDFPKDLSFKNKAKELRIKLIQESIDSNNFALSKQVLSESYLMYPELKKNNDELSKKMVEKDFKVNYFGTRILVGKSEPNVTTYKWNGIVDSCKVGVMKNDVVYKLEDRINYFRRMAGVNEITLTNDYNENCQFAALMCEANRSMSHEPNDGWRCYVPAGFDALKLSILSRDNNPSIAITAAMGHNHTTVGNRRWLLYPYSSYMGIGTSNNYTSLLAIDNSNIQDSNVYKSKYIAWPPQGYVPKMMVFKKWSFSMEQNFDKAIVSMKNSKNENIELKTEPIANGYGLNSIVWEPISPIVENETYTVVVKLNNGKVYTYSVTPITTP